MFESFPYQRSSQSDFDVPPLVLIKIKIVEKHYLPI